MKGSSAFSLLEVVLATVVFSLAVVGLARGLGDMIGVLGGTARLQDSQRALDSAAMRVLATSNRISPSGWERIQGQQKDEPVIQQMVRREERVRLAPEKDKNPVPVTGWVQVRLRAIAGSGANEELVFLCNEIR